MKQNLDPTGRALSGHVTLPKPYFYHLVLRPNLLNRDPDGLANAIRSGRSFMNSIAKAKTAKLVKTLIDYFSASPLNQHPQSSHIQIVITRENIEWARLEKRVFLRQSLEIKLCGLLFDSKQTKEALALIANLLKELKKLDDKMILTEVHLLESRIRHALSDSPKANVSASRSHIYSLDHIMC